MSRNASGLLGAKELIGACSSQIQFRPEHADTDPYEISWKTDFETREFDFDIEGEGLKITIVLFLIKFHFYCAARSNCFFT